MEAYGENFNIKIPENIVEECSHVGECYYDCLDNISRVKFPSREIIISELKETGGWLYQDLLTMSLKELQVKFLWVICCNIAEGRYK